MSQGAVSGQILSRHALLRPGREQPRLLDHAFGGFVKPVAVAIRAIDHTGGDNRFAAFANLEVAGCGDDFFGACRAVGEMGVFGGHKDNLSAPEDVEKRVDGFANRLLCGCRNRLQSRRDRFENRLARSGNEAF